MGGVWFPPLWSTQTQLQHFWIQNCHVCTIWSRFCAVSGPGISKLSLSGPLDCDAQYSALHSSEPRKFNFDTKHQLRPQTTTSTSNNNFDLKHQLRAQTST